MIQFFSGKVPTGYSSFEESLYLQHAHRQLQSRGMWLSYYIADDKKKKVIGAIHFCMQQRQAQSPYRAPHGGLELVKPVSKKNLAAFWAFVSADLASRKCLRVAVKCASRLADEDNLIEASMMQSGFQCVMTEAAAIIPVTNEYRKRLHESERKRLNKCLRAGMEVQPLPANQIKPVYEFIKACRQAKNYVLSLSWAAMQKLVKAFPQRVVPFVVMKDDHWVAASLIIVVNDQLVYDFYHDHDAAYDAYSPVVLLVEGIHEWCRQHGYSQIDLGTSMRGDQVNTGLYRFKLRLGAQPAIKNTFVKVL